MVQKIIVALCMSSALFITASQKDVKTGKEQNKKPISWYEQNQMNVAAKEACSAQKYDKAEHWLKHGADANNVFVWACGARNAPAVSLALECGANLNDPLVKKVVDSAFGGGYLPIIDLLLADPRVDLGGDERGQNTKLQMAAFRDQKDVVKRLLYFGVKPTMSHINLWDGKKEKMDPSCAYEWASNFKNDYTAWMIKQAHEGKLRLCMSVEEATHFYLIKQQRDKKAAAFQDSLKFAAKL